MLQHLLVVKYTSYTQNLERKINGNKTYIQVIKRYCNQIYKNRTSDATKLRLLVTENFVKVLNDQFFVITEFSDTGSFCNARVTRCRCSPLSVHCRLIQVRAAFALLRTSPFPTTVPITRILECATNSVLNQCLRNFKASNFHNCR